MLALYNTNVLKVKEFKDDEGLFINATTGLTASVVSMSGATLVSGVPLTYIPATSGNYKGYIPHDIDLTLNDTYTVVVTGTINGNHFHKPQNEVARYN